MIWEADAESEIRKAPFFIRKKVRKKVEAHVAGKGATSVSLADVTALKKKFLSKGGMEKEIRGFEVSTCFGASGCPHAAVPTERLAKEIETILKNADLLGFLKQHVAGDLKFHHEFRVALSDCPNACSRPQIVDIGIIGSIVPGLSEIPCTGCRACEQICPELAILLTDPGEIKTGIPSQATAELLPRVDASLCLDCGKCVRTCPTGTLYPETSGFTVLLGGRLGRHPRLGMPVPGIKTHEQVLEIVHACIHFYKTHSTSGCRFSHLLAHVDQVVGNR